MDTVAIRHAIRTLNDTAEAIQDPKTRQAVYSAGETLARALADHERRAARKHVLGDRDAPTRSVPDLQRSAHRTKLAALTTEQQKAIVSERGRARNIDGLDLSNTHYEQNFDWWF